MIFNEVLWQLGAMDEDSRGGAADTKFSISAIQHVAFCLSKMDQTDDTRQVAIVSCISRIFFIWYFLLDSILALHFVKDSIS